MASAQSPSLADRWARAPFYFNSAAHLLRIGRERATNLNELLAALRACPNDSIFAHTFQTLQERPAALVGPGDQCNALQGASTIVVQKSIKEGFGLTVTEALWKSKPVIAGAVGGIPTQIIHKLTGVLVHSVEAAPTRSATCSRTRNSRRNWAATGGNTPRKIF